MLNGLLSCFLWFCCVFCCLVCCVKVFCCLVCCCVEEVPSCCWAKRRDGFGYCVCVCVCIEYTYLRIIIRLSFVFSLLLHAERLIVGKRTPRSPSSSFLYSQRRKKSRGSCLQNSVSFFFQSDERTETSFQQVRSKSESTVPPDHYMAAARPVVKDPTSR